MNPFLELEVCHAGGGKDDLPEKTVMGRILPGEIAMHYPGYHWGAIVVLKSGYTFLTTMTSDDLDAARQAYAAMQKKNPTNTNNIQLTKKSKLHAAD
jgi:hypothetical protein